MGSQETQIIVPTKSAIKNPTQKINKANLKGGKRSLNKAKAAIAKSMEAIERLE